MNTFFLMPHDYILIFKIFNCIIDKQLVVTFECHWLFMLSLYNYIYMYMFILRRIFKLSHEHGEHNDESIEHAKTLTRYDVYQDEN